MKLDGHPALVVIDMQNGFCKPGGFMSKLGLDHTPSAAVIDPVARLVGIARGAGLPIFFTRYWLKPDYSDAGLLLELLPAVKDHGGMVRETWDGDLVEELEPQPGDEVLDKTRHSAFYETDFDDRLTRLGIDTLVICGVTTNVCVEATARDGFTHDYRIVIVSDASAAVTPEMHTGTLTTIEYCMGEVATSRCKPRSPAVTDQRPPSRDERRSHRPCRAALDGGIIDIVCNPHTPAEVEARLTGVDHFFMDKVRMSAEVRAGVAMPDYVAKMDRAGIERSLLIAVRAGDPRMKYSFGIATSGWRSIASGIPGGSTAWPGSTRHGSCADCASSSGASPSTGSSAPTCTRTGSSSRPTTGSTTRSTPSAASWTYRSRCRSAIAWTISATVFSPALGARTRSTAWPSTSPS